MRRFAESRFFIVVLIVCLAVVLVPTVLSAMGLGSVVRSGIATVLSPVQKVFSYVADGIGGFSAYFTEFDRLTEENERLRDEVAKMRDEINSAEEMEQMNGWLFNYLELKREHTDLTLEPANVTGHGSQSYSTVFTLDCGTSKGIEKGMAVVTNEGVVGHVVEVGRSWSKASTLLESGTTIGAAVERTGEVGLVEGDFALASESTCRMIYLSPDSDVKEGDRIVTTGTGSVYPPDLVIGYVSSVETDTLNRTKLAYVKLSADTSDLKHVMVVTGYERTSE